MSLIEKVRSQLRQAAAYHGDESRLRREAIRRRRMLEDRRRPSEKEAPQPAATDHLGDADVLRPAHMVDHLSEQEVLHPAEVADLN